MNRGDVYDAQLSPTEGSEQRGTRPVVIVSRNAINNNSTVIVIVPLTDAANVKRHYPNNVLIPAEEGGLKLDSVALAGQARAVDVSRLLRRRGTLSTDTMRAIDRALRITLDL
jgi:mRNA interferase MazF